MKSGTLFRFEYITHGQKEEQSAKKQDNTYSKQREQTYSSI